MNPSSSRFSVFVVDDAPIVCEALRWVIEETPDLELVGEAWEGNQALFEVARLSPDVVVIDIHLPDLDGYSVARAIKSLNEHPIIVFLSVDSDEDAERRGFESGGDAFVAKAQGWDVLLATIRTALSDYDKKEQLAR